MLSKASDQLFNFKPDISDEYPSLLIHYALFTFHDWVVKHMQCQTILDTFTSALYYPDKRSGFCNMYAMHALVSFSMCTFWTWWAFKDCQLQPDSGSLFSLFNVSGPYIITNELLIRNAVRRKSLCCVKLLKL